MTANKFRIAFALIGAAMMLVLLASIAPIWYGHLRAKQDISMDDRARFILINWSGLEYPDLEMASKEYKVELVHKSLTILNCGDRVWYLLYERFALGYNKEMRNLLIARHGSTWIDEFSNNNTKHPEP